MDLIATLTRLEKIQTELLGLVQEVRSIEAELKNVASQNSSLEPFLNAEDVAKLLRVETAFIYAQARARKIPSTRLGKYVRFSPLQIRKWLDRRSTT